MNNKYKLFCLTTLMLISGCGYYNKNSFEIENLTKDQLTKVSVNFAGTTVKRDFINAGTTVHFEGVAPNEGIIQLEFYRRGKIEQYDVIYVSPRLKVNCKFIVTTQSYSRNCKH